jgi:hypothetical protein
LEEQEYDEGEWKKYQVTETGIVSTFSHIDRLKLSWYIVNDMLNVNQLLT